MSEKNALTISIGVLGAVAVWLTAEVVQVPVWVVFIAWASFFILGGGPRGLLQSAASNLTGIVIASVCLLVAQQAELGVWLTGVVVGLGSALMVAVSRVPLLAAIPAIVWGFASTVGTSAVTGRDVLYADSVGNPVLMVATAMLLGGLFGIASETFANLITTRTESREATA
ncbi:DUF1097 domain-containing protein [Mycobacterium hodleri]|uniref:DUF1097 domain-containing protein n=1 Tax=Mycolicibacterium hodleri TaxID=49897 RepID=UPI0021F265FE|nr:DUF1097 domain-containing protein [Mycolicibacterium hodleri]MCV7133272.1 DUF1097 domain-containing protein [Mycolicibacterium hodleri]